MLRYQPTPIQEIHDIILDNAGIRLLIKREDLNHPLISGNKWWKLKYNLEEAQRLGKGTLLTFGGAYSNHIYATAAAAQECGFQSVGVIRGEETLPLNPTLTFAMKAGMKLIYCPRDEFRKKYEPEFINKLQDRVGNFYLLPEGGSNALAVKGVKEFAESMQSHEFDYVCVPIGTGGTLAGLIAGLKERKRIIGFSSLKGGEFLHVDVNQLLEYFPYTNNWRVETSYHHGGYAKRTNQLMQFLLHFENKHRFRLDPVYTGKMMYGIFDLVEKGMFTRGSTILAIHTGGLQGWGVSDKGA